GDAHAGDDVFLPVQLDLLIPFHAFGADTVVNRVEIVLAIRRFEQCSGGRGFGGRARSHGAHECGESSVLQEGSAIESVILGHTVAPVHFRAIQSRNSVGHGPNGQILQPMHRGRAIDLRTRVKSHPWPPSSRFPTPSTPQMTGSWRWLAKCEPQASCLSTGFTEAARTCTITSS